jgi:hypothetical protein
LKITKISILQVWNSVEEFDWMIRQEYMFEWQLVMHFGTGLKALVVISRGFDWV